ncbi:UNVERIFIED_CONTAM: hypothetical protein Sradi_5245100 [Sesamum radiatum]|uniref:Helitron helicase-like domain-containing protein n=1 Tax=Sesamum radiatum TaxID=300843 RepID=A0AAW2LNR6_SESRA
MFAFTSMGGCIDNRINVGHGPYCFVLNGQNHHLIRSLLPDVDRSPNFMQLYVIDAKNEVRNRIRALNKDDRNQNFDPNIIQGLHNMFDDHNPLTKVLRMARDRFRESDYMPVRLRFIRTRKKDGRQYNLPTTSEVVALIVGDGQQSRGTCDIVIKERGKGLQRITELHPSFMAMQYPLLFPYGEDGFRMDITRNSRSQNSLQPKVKGNSSACENIMLIGCKIESVKHIH